MSLPFDMFRDMSDFERSLAKMAAGQHGAFTRCQAKQAGASRSAIHHRIATGRWAVAAPGVLVVAGTPQTEAQALQVNLLSLGPTAMASHQSAGSLHCFDAIPKVCAVTVPHFDHRRRVGVTVHQQRVHEIDRTEVSGFPVTTVQRTLCDLAMVFSLTRIRHVVETVHRDRVSSLTAIGTTLLRVGTAGRPGSSKLLTVLDELGPGEPIPRTRLEELLDDVVSRSGLPAAEPQHPLPGTGRRSGLVDRAFPEARLIIEADSRRWHARHSAMVADRERDFEAARAGWITVRLMYDQLAGDPDDMAAGLVETYHRRLRDVA